MQKSKVFLLVLLLAISVNCDILTCAKDVVRTVPTLTQIILALTQFRLDVRGILELIREIKALKQNCDLRICLEHATERCQADNSQGCEQYGLIIYPKCASGYQNFGCCLCNQICPNEFRDDGAYCAKPGSYGRGAGYPWKFGDKAFNYDGARRRCESENSQGCEQNGLIYYPKCRANFHAVGCCVCSPDCPSGMTDIGVSCQKKTYGRGVGYPFKFGDCKDIPKKYPLDTQQSKEVQMKQLQNILVDVDFLIEQNNDYDRANIVYERAQVMMETIVQEFPEQ